MRNLGLLAFIVTTCVLVPAAVHQLRAGHEQVVKFGSPDHGELELGTAKIVATIDHALVDPNEAIHVTLTASGAKGKRLEVGVLAYGSAGDEGGRVPSPPVRVSRETVTIPIDREGNGTRQLAIKLRGAVPMWGGSLAAHYTILVLAPKAAAKLDRLRRGAALIGGGKDDPIPSYNRSAERFMQLYAWNSDREGEDATLFAEGAVARLSAHTRSINPAITIETPDRTTAGEAFTVAVVVKNPTRRKLTDLELSLETPTGVTDDVYGSDQEAETDGKVNPSQGVEGLVMPDTATFALAPGETRRLEFRVMPDHAGLLGLYAHVTYRGDDSRTADKLTASGTFDATEIVAAPPVVAESL